MTIARTIARKYSEQKRLGASFFFSTGGGDRSHTGKFFTTIAVQLANVSSTLKDSIYEAVAEHNDIANQALRADPDDGELALRLFRSNRTCGLLLFMAMLVVGLTAR